MLGSRAPHALDTDPVVRTADARATEQVGDTARPPVGQLTGVHFCAQSDGSSACWVFVFSTSYFDVVCSEPLM